VKTPTASRPPRLLDRVRAAIRLRHYSLRTEQAYVGWIRRYIHFHGVRHPDEMGSVEVVEFLSDLAVRHQVAASTQNQALSALLLREELIAGVRRVAGSGGVENVFDGDVEP